MILSNDGFDAFHYRSYGTFFLHKIGSIISIGDLPTTNIIEPKKLEIPFLESFYLFLTAKISTRITIPKDTMVPNGAAFSSKIFSENSSRAIANSSKALHSIISLKLGLRFVYFKNDLSNLLISTIPF